MSTTPLPRRLRGGAALAAVLAAAVLTGCGSGETPAAAGTSAEQSSASSPAPSPSPSAPAPSPSPSPSAPGNGTPTVSTLEATLVDFAVEIPETELPAGSYTIAVANDGGGSHDLVVEGPDGGDVAASEILAPGESGTVEVVLEPGEYVFYCSVGTHRAMGMELVVTVV